VDTNPPYNACTCGSESPAILWEKNGIAYFRCGECGLVFIDPRSYASTDFAAVYEERAQGDITQSRHESASAKEFTDRIECLRLWSQVELSNAALLDVGSGAGDFLACAKKYIGTVEGAEISPTHAHHSRKEFGVTVHEGNWEGIQVPEARYDIVVLSHVLEHLPYPDRALKKVFSCVRGGGIVLVEVPNFRSLARMVKGKHHWVFGPDHLFYFSLPSLSRMLVAAGFVPCAHRTLAGGNYAGFFGRFFLKGAGWWLNRSGLGGMLEIVARRPPDAVSL
jgi:2-polyprenyl-3-methyl-5-hydroxy-6-metoxy-1,4-benzoquinol methylase